MIRLVGFLSDIKSPTFLCKALIYLDYHDLTAKPNRKIIGEDAPKFCAIHLDVYGREKIATTLPKCIALAHTG